MLCALGDRHGAKYVNFRDSKLTRLLKDALVGNCRTVMIAHISPASCQYEESRNTLAYADRAKNIKTKIRRNVCEVAYHISQYTSIINELRTEVKRLRSRLGVDVTVSRRPSMTSQTRSADVSTQNQNFNEFQKTKDQLVSTLKAHQSIRSFLVQLHSELVEIGLKYIRSTLRINTWEREKSSAAFLPLAEGSDPVEGKTQASVTVSHEINLNYSMCNRCTKHH